MNALEEQLDPAIFFCAGRKEILNLRWIERLNVSIAGGLLVTLRGGKSVEMSRRQFGAAEGSAVVVNISTLKRYIPYWPSARYQYRRPLRQLLAAGASRSPRGGNVQVDLRVLNSFLPSKSEPRHSLSRAFSSFQQNAIPTMIRFGADHESCRRCVSGLDGVGSQGPESPFFRVFNEWYLCEDFLIMPNPMHAFVLGTDGNLWLETGPWGNIGQVIQQRQLVDQNVSQIFAQVGGFRTWRPAFQPLSISELFAIHTDGSLWFEYQPVPNAAWQRYPVDDDVSQIYALDSNTVYVLGSDGKLWLEIGPWGSIANTIRDRLQVDGSVQGFQPLDTENIFVLGNDGNLWLEHGPWGNVANTINSRRFIDGNVLQFWALNMQQVFVCRKDASLWLEIGNNESPQAIDSNVVDFQPLDPNTVFVLGRDGNLWLEIGPFGNITETIARRKLVGSGVVTFEALNPNDLYINFATFGTQTLFYGSAPWSSNDLLTVDGTVSACYPLYGGPIST